MPQQGIAPVIVVASYNKDRRQPYGIPSLPACHVGQTGGTPADARAPVETLTRVSDCVPDRLFLKAGVLMIARHLHTVHELLSVVAQPTEEMPAAPVDTAGVLPISAHPGAPLESRSCHLACADWLLRPPSSQPDPALDQFWTC